MGGVGDVTLPQDLPGRGNIHSQQSAIKLSEVDILCVHEYSYVLVTTTHSTSYMYLSKLYT